MESPRQTATRLLAALEDLAAQEAAAVHAGDFAAVGPVQARAAVVGEKLCTLAGEDAGPALRPRVAALLQRRQETRQELARRIAACRDELRHADEARRRLTRIAPAYRAHGRSPRFNAAA